MNIQPHIYFLAQSSGQLAQEATKDTTEVISQITIEKIIQGIFVILTAYVVLRVIDKVIIWISEKIAKEWRLRVKQFLPFLRMTVLTATTIILLNLFLNLSQENIIAVTGTVAVALGFAFKDYASSIIAGIVGLFEAPYSVGDRIQIGEFYGEVISYGIRAVKIQTPDDNTITIPHNKIWTEAISNANTGALEAQVVTEFHFAHDIEVNLVRKNSLSSCPD